MFLSIKRTVGHYLLISVAIMINSHFLFWTSSFCCGNVGEKTPVMHLKNSDKSILYNQLVGILNMSLSFTFGWTFSWNSLCFWVLHNQPSKALHNIALLAENFLLTKWFKSPPFFIPEILMILFELKSAILQNGQSWQTQWDFPLALSAYVNPAFTEEGPTISFSSFRMLCQDVQMKIFTFYIALLLSAHIHLALCDKVMPICPSQVNEWCLDVDLWALENMRVENS